MKEIATTCIIIVTFVVLIYLSHAHIQTAVHKQLNLEEAFQESLDRYGKK